MRRLDCCDAVPGLPTRSTRITASQLPALRVKLLVDCCLPYSEYFQLYRECAGLPRLGLTKIPSWLWRPLVVLYGLPKLVGLEIFILGKLMQALLHYNFSTGRSPPEGYAILKEAISESLADRPT